MSAINGSFQRWNDEEIRKSEVDNKKKGGKKQQKEENTFLVFPFRLLKKGYRMRGGREGRVEKRHGPLRAEKYGDPFGERCDSRIC